MAPLCSSYCRALCAHKSSAGLSAHVQPGAWLQRQVVDLRGLHARRAAHLHGQRRPLRTFITRLGMNLGPQLF